MNMTGNTHNESTIAGFFLDGWYVFDNFAPCQVEWRGVLYPTSEHAYQAAHFFGTNPARAEQVRLCGVGVATMLGAMSLARSGCVYGMNCKMQVIIIP